MHWAEFGEEEVPFPPHANRPSSRHPQYTTKEADMNVSSSQSALLLAAIKEYDANKWKAIGAKVNKPAKVKLVSCATICLEKEKKKRRDHQSPSSWLYGPRPTESNDQYAYDFPYPFFFFPSCVTQKF